MIVYLLKSASCLTLFLFFYHFILEKEKMYNFNRFYLLGSILFSVLIPLATITIPNTSEIIEVEKNYNTPILIEESSPIILEETFNYAQLYIAFYILISSIFLLRFAKNLFKIIQKIRQNEQVKHEKAILILVAEKILPHTFWNYIFINKNDYENQKIEEELFTHELTHVTQKHTFDVLLIELLQIIFWINPLFIFIKKAIQLNHEFLADETVINLHKNTFQYQHLLLNKASWKNEYYLASNLNYLLTKKRLKMMTTQSSPIRILLKKLAVIPLLTGFIFLFAERVEAQEVIEIKEEPIETIVEQVFTNKGDKINTGFIELKGETHYFVNVNNDTKYYNRKGQLADNTGKILSNKKAKSSEVIPDNYITRTFYKNKVFCEFYDDKPSEKAKWQKLPNGDKIEIIEIKEQNEREKKYIDSPIQNYNAPISNGSQQSVPFMTTSIKVDKESNNGKIKDIRLKLKDVNALKINYTKDSIKFHKNWFITIDNQKYYYTFDKNERIARYYKNGKLVNLDIVKEYKKKHKIFEKLKASGKHYVFKPENDKKEIDREFSDLEGIYFRMSRADKNKVPYPENPVKPYIKLRKGDKVWYKKRDELTAEDKLLLPPPPPVPNATKEQILEAKKAYDAWKKRIGDNLPPPPPPAKKAKNPWKIEIRKNPPPPPSKQKDTLKPKR